MSRRRLLALLVVLAVVVVVAGVTFTVTRGLGAGGGTPAAAPATAISGTPTPFPSATAWTGPPSDKLELKLRRVIVSSSISPKSVVSTGTGYVFAQNMMYKHSVTVYDSMTLKLVKTIQDAVDLAKYGVKGHSGAIRGAPVEAAMTPDKRFMFIANYSMYGDDFYKEGHDVCSPSSGYDTSYVYRVPLTTLKIDKVIHVGSVPKYVAVTGSYNIARVDLRTFKVWWISGVGSVPRHLCRAGNGKYLHASRGRSWPRCLP